MNNSKKNGLSLLTKKTASIVGAALAAIIGIQTASANVGDENISQDDATKTISSKKGKLMPILKLNRNNIENSTFTMGHRSHSSHSSHSSHYSHRSGAMFN